MTTKQKAKTVTDWMQENDLTSDSLAGFLGCSSGAVDKWRQDLSYPGQIARVLIKQATKKHGWTPFPERIA